MSTPTSNDLSERVVDAAVEFYGSADKQISARLANAGTSMAVHLTDTDGAGFSVYLDRNPIATAAEPRDDCESHLYATTQQMLDVFTGRLHMTMAIAKQEMTYTGAIRKYLTIIPCHRRMDFSPFVALLKDVRAGTVHISNGDSGGH
jgi:putative sterol carrier protein